MPQVKPRDAAARSLNSVNTAPEATLSPPPPAPGFSITEVRGVVRDDRELTRGVNSVLESDLEGLIDASRFRGARVLEIGPKQGFHSRWIDRTLHPSMLTMVELPQKRVYAEEWLSELRCPHEIVYESLIAGRRLLDMPRFDLVFCTGVLYHTVEHFKVLHTLRRLTNPGGLMVFQSSVDLTHDEPVILLKWTDPAQTGSYAHPSKRALFMMLEMTGWTGVRHYVDYRPASNAVLLTCEPAEKPHSGYDGVPFGGSTV